VRRRSLLIASALLLGLLALPASAHAVADVGVTQSVSSHVVNPGGTVTVTATVRNNGDEPPPYGSVYVELGSLSDYGHGADNPYQSASASNGGTCQIQSGMAYGYHYHWVDCDLGALAPGETAQITATVKVNEGMFHDTTLLPNLNEGGYSDDRNANNRAVDRVAIDKPPVVTGSAKLRITGIPPGCARGDFTINVTASGTQVRKVKAFIFLGFDENGSGIDFGKQQRGRHLVAKIPVSKISYPPLTQEYKLTVRAKRGGRKPYVKTISFTVC
jgi:hypothetical protein